METVTLNHTPVDAPTFEAAMARLPGLQHCAVDEAGEKVGIAEVFARADGSHGHRVWLTGAKPADARAVRDHLRACGFPAVEVLLAPKA